MKKKIDLLEFIPKKDSLIQLKDSFRNELFLRISKRFHNYTEAAKRLDVNRVNFYNYKNGYAKSIPLKFILELIKIGIITKTEIEKNTVQIFSKLENTKLRLKNGSKFRHDKLKRWKKEIPSPREIFNRNYIDFGKWFKKYRKLLNIGGARTILKEEYSKNKIIIGYTNYVKGKKKYFEKTLPKKISLNKNFFYFLGLWVGDRCGGGRFGVLNKNQTINRVTQEFIRTLCQENPKWVLYIAKSIHLPKNVKFNEVIRINHKRNGYAVSVHVINGFLVSFFRYLERNLDEILEIIPKDIFFAGLFDAEGNVCFEDKCFRWSCKDKKKIKIYIKHLRELNLFDRFDGVNLITSNAKNFSEKILTYMKHPQKVNDASLLIYGKGKLNNRFKNILEYIKNNPGKPRKEIAKALKRVKLYSQIKFLKDFGYIEVRGYPGEVFTKPKGLNELRID